MTTKPTIWDALAEKLGREPTNKEASDEVARILREGREEAHRKTFGYEITPEGEQAVIPGCERNASPWPGQMDLFG